MTISTLRDTLDRLHTCTGDETAIRQIADELPADELAEVLAYFAWIERRQRRPRGLRVPAGMAVHHVDGNPHNNDLGKPAVRQAEGKRHPGAGGRGRGGGHD